MHSNDHKKCDRCNRSIRPSCKNCGHSLSGEVIHDGVNLIATITTCEVCGTIHKLDDGLISVIEVIKKK